MTYLLDSNVWVAMLRKKNPQVAMRFGAIDRADIRTCSVVVAELRYGCAKSAKAVANRAIVDALLAPVASLSYDDLAADHFVADQPLLVRNDLHIEDHGHAVSGVGGNEGESVQQSDGETGPDSHGPD